MYSNARDSLRVLQADLATRYSLAKRARLQGLLLRLLELIAVLDRRQPEAELVRVVVAVTLGAVALDERSRPEVFQARARTRERLTTALRTSSGVL